MNSRFKLVISTRTAVSPVGKVRGMAEGRWLKPLISRKGHYVGDPVHRELSVEY